jgi:hypothetical protein
MNENALNSLKAVSREIDDIKNKYYRVIAQTDNLIFSFDYAEKTGEWFGAIKKIM